jgi:hypothetical protein
MLTDAPTPLPAGEVTPIHVLLVDDHPAVRHGIRQPSALDYNRELRRPQHRRRG